MTCGGGDFNLAGLSEMMFVKVTGPEDNGTWRLPTFPDQYRVVIEIVKPLEVTGVIDSI